MKNLISQLLVLFCLASVPALAVADDRYDPRRGFTSIDSFQWRLGSFRGGLRGHEILYKMPGSRRWEVAPGGAVAVNDGWVLGTDQHRGGYGIYRWNGRDWSRMPGSAVKIGGSYRQPWVVNDRGVRYVWSGYSWREDSIGGRGRDNRNDRDDRWNRQDRDDRWDRDDRNDRGRNGGRNNRR